MDSFQNCIPNFYEPEVLSPVFNVAAIDAVALNNEDFQGRQLCDGGRQPD